MIRYSRLHGSAPALPPSIPIVHILDRLSIANQAISIATVAIVVIVYITRAITVIAIVTKHHH